MGPRPTGVCQADKRFRLHVSQCTSGCYPCICFVPISGAKPPSASEPCTWVAVCYVRPCGFQPVQNRALGINARPGAKGPDRDQPKDGFCRIGARDPVSHAQVATRKNGGTLDGPSWAGKRDARGPRVLDVGPGSRVRSGVPFVVYCETNPRGWFVRKKKKEKKKKRKESHPLNAGVCL
jgi:hypothetical protein